jgi:hypothetical protein
MKPQIWTPPAFANDESLQESELTKLCKELEHFVTPEWAVEAILKREILTPMVFDPCMGCGVLVRAARTAGYCVEGMDIYQWGGVQFVADFLALTRGSGEGQIDLEGYTVFMNPPFSKACEFVEKAFELGARKVVCFQRFAWRESGGRKDFWTKYPPNRIYICGDRADCWRYDLHLLPKEKRINPKSGKVMAGTPTAHAWFVFERGQPQGTLLGHIYKEDQ